jgi:hypothetical protein
VLGTALVSSLSVLGMFAVGWRRGGALVALAAMAAYRRDLVAMAREDLLDVGAADQWRAKLDRYADLQIAWDHDTVAAWLGPVAEGGR